MATPQSAYFYCGQFRPSSSHTDAASRPRWTSAANRTPVVAPKPTRRGDTADRGTVRHPDPYQLLQCRRDATASELRQAYGRLALWHHPARQSNAPRRAAQHTDHFRTVAAAYETLSDPDTRHALDALLHHPTTDSERSLSSTGRYVVDARVQYEQKATDRQLLRKQQQQKKADETSKAPEMLPSTMDELELVLTDASSSSSSSSCESDCFDAGSLVIDPSSHHDEDDNSDDDDTNFDGPCQGPLRLCVCRGVASGGGTPTGTNGNLATPTPSRATTTANSSTKSPRHRTMQQQPAAFCTAPHNESPTTRRRRRRPFPSLARLSTTSSTSSDATTAGDRRHYSTAVTERMFGGPLAVLYQARQYRPFTDPLVLFRSVFGSSLWPVSTRTTTAVVTHGRSSGATSPPPPLSAPSTWSSRTTTTKTVDPSDLQTATSTAGAAGAATTTTTTTTTNCETSSDRTATATTTTTTTVTVRTTPYRTVTRTVTRCTDDATGRTRTSVEVTATHHDTTSDAATHRHTLGPNDGTTRHATSHHDNDNHTFHDEEEDRWLMGCQEWLPACVRC